MRILLDSRDLINLVEHARPLPLQESTNYIQTGDHQLVLTFTNVRELSAPLADGIDFMRVRPLLQSLERMPCTYMREVTIVASEIQSAVDAFNSNLEYVACSPYVRRWDYTLGRDEPPTANWINFRLDEIVEHINRERPDVFAPPERHLPRLQRLLHDDRVLLRAGQVPNRQHFSHALRNHAASHRIDLPNGREDEFADWVYEDANRCPGLRLNHETYRALMENYEDVPEAADFADLAHVFAVPYVDAATLDRRMRHYCTVGSREMIRPGAAINYSERVYNNMAAFIQQHP